MTHYMLTEPKWTTCDRAVDASDVWLDEMDPENEDGAEVTAYLFAAPAPCVDSNHECYDASGFQLAGISINTDGLTSFHDRAWCRDLLGMSAIWRIEDSEMEAA